MIQIIRNMDYLTTRRENVEVTEGLLLPGTRSPNLVAKKKCTSVMMSRIDMRVIQTRLDELCNLRDSVVLFISIR